MTAANIFCFFIFIIVALLMIGIGVSQLRSQKPVGFYSGEQPPKEEELKDVPAWNVRHGLMWLIYGIIIIISYFAWFLIGDSVWCIIPVCGGLIVPIVVMIWYHHRLIKRYKK